MCINKKRHADVTLHAEPNKKSAGCNATDTDEIGNYMDCNWLYAVYHRRNFPSNHESQSYHIKYNYCRIYYLLGVLRNRYPLLVGGYQCQRELIFVLNRN